MIELAENYEIPRVASNYTLSVSLENFSDEAITEYLRSRGFAVDGERKPVTNVVVGATTDEGDVVVDAEMADRLAKLVRCGLRQAAREELIEFVGRATGVKL